MVVLKKSRGAAEGKGHTHILGKVKDSKKPYISSLKKRMISKLNFHLLMKH